MILIFILNKYIGSYIQEQITNNLKNKCMSFVSNSNRNDGGFPCLGYLKKACLLSQIHAA